MEQAKGCLHLELCHGVLRLQDATALFAQNLTIQSWQFAPKAEFYWFLSLASAD